ncbi:MAG: carbohydrate kinase family protein [Armatimonadota bacterium]
MRYRALLGTGGIGAGMFFSLRGNHTLGREESRLGRILDRRDYCKLHIIVHYVQALLGPTFTTLPIGKVGEDEWGTRLCEEMAEVGMDLRHTTRVPGEQTLFSFCFVYPDGDGGNITTDDSACAKVDPACIHQAEPDFARFAGRGVALAAPEVPLPAREALLKLATKHGLLRVASFNSEEMPTALEAGYLTMVDLLAINIDEAKAAAGITTEELPAESVVEAAVARLRSIQPQMKISITAGKQGSWGWDGSTLTHVPPCKVNLVSSAGAGDAHLAGTIAGLAAGLPMAEAQQLGGLVGGLSVTSPHTINKDVNRETLRAFAETAGVELAESVKRLLSEP